MNACAVSRIWDLLAWRNEEERYALGLLEYAGPFARTSRPNVGQAAATGAGLLVTAWSVLHFLKVKGTPVPFNPPPKVVATGPYRYARNPMLTGVFVFMFGLGFFFNSASLVFFFAPLYVIINVWELKKIEEPELIKRLGDEYIKYQRNTPMFIPGCKTRSQRQD